MIYLDTVHAPIRERAVGPTARYLLEKRPCRIIVEIDHASTKRKSSVVPGRA